MYKIRSAVKKGFTQKFEVFRRVKLEKKNQTDSVSLIRTHIVKCFFVRINYKYLINLEVHQALCRTVVKINICCENKYILMIYLLYQIFSVIVNGLFQ